MRIPVSLRAPQRTPFLLVAKSGLAAVTAWLVAGWAVQGPPPVFAAIAALLVVQPSLNQSFGKAIERSVGVIIGVLIATLLGVFLGGGTPIVLLAIVSALLIAWALRMTSGTTNQVAISAMLVLALAAATPGYAVDRILETVIGAVIGILVNIALVPPVAMRPAREAVDRLLEEIASSLERLADALDTARTPAELQGLLIEARLMRPMRDAAEAAIATSEESLALNPRGRGHRQELADLAALLDRFGPIVTQVIGMTRAVADLYDDGISEEPAVRAIAEQLRRAAHDARRELSRTLPREEPVVPADEPAALTAPLDVSAPSRRHWMLVGSLLVDLRRVHEALGEQEEPPATTGVRSIRRR